LVAEEKVGFSICGYLATESIAADSGVLPGDEDDIRNDQ
jgi:hypothetical protein